MSILLTRDTRFIIQGITGREAVNLTRENLDYGAKIVGGVTPGRAGRDVYGVPVYDCVRDAVAANGGSIDGSIVSVPPAFTQDAIIEALENGIKLIVVVTENVPRKQVAQAVELAELRGARIIGPNCLGIISPDECKMGGVGGPAANTRQAYKKGPIGVMSRSGGMTTEIASTLTAAGLGQSTCVSIGGDAIVGTTYAELMPFFEADPETQAIAIYSEPGGRMEAELAEWVRSMIQSFRSSLSWRAASWTRCRACASATPVQSSKAKTTRRPRKSSECRQPASPSPNGSKRSRRCCAVVSKPSSSIE